MTTHYIHVKVLGCKQQEFLTLVFVNARKSFATGTQIHYIGCCVFYSDL